MDQFGGQPPGLDFFTANQGHHRFHGGDPEAVLRLADGRERHLKIFRRQDVAKSDNRDVLGNFQAL